MKIEGRFIEVSAAAKKLGVSDDTIRRLIRDDKEIVAVKIRGTYRIPERNIEEYLDRMAKKVQESAEGI